jgi:hypothetical protein
VSEPVGEVGRCISRHGIASHFQYSSAWVHVAAAKAAAVRAKDAADMDIPHSLQRADSQCRKVFGEPLPAPGLVLRDS